MARPEGEAPVGRECCAEPGQPASPDPAPQSVSLGAHAVSCQKGPPTQGALSAPSTGAGAPRAWTGLLGALGTGPSRPL